jgi:hypothetical protein
MESEELVCEWCGESFVRPNKMGPAPTYCSQSHRERAYEVKVLERVVLDIWTALCPPDVDGWRATIGAADLARHVGELVAERDDLKADLARERHARRAIDQALMLTVRGHAKAIAERDRLRAVVDALRGYLSIQDVHEEDSPEVAGVLTDLRGILAEEATDG